MAKILVIEDESAIRMVLEMFLEEEGHECYQAAEGHMGLELLHQGFTPDLIILDLYLKGVSGREILGQIRSIPRLEYTPVIIITGALLSAEVLPAQDSCQALMPKPFDLIDLGNKINALLMPN